MPQSETTQAMAISAILHGVLFLGFWIYSSILPPSVPTISLQPETGSRIQWFARTTQPGVGTTSDSRTPPDSDTPGASALEREVSAIRKKILYPPQALEKGLESECEWIVTVAENRKVESMAEVKKCRYMVFREAFQAALDDWEFQLPPGTQIRIPISFRIQNE